MRLTQTMILNKHKMYQIPQDEYGFLMSTNKLGRLEDIEEDLGIDLVTLFKAFENGVYYKIDNEIEFGTVEHFVPYMNKKLHLRPLYKELRLSLKDYGKTWALTKEELE